VYNLFLENTKHYVFLSTYRVYSSDELPIKETSPRQLEASKDEYYLSLEKKEYALYKARQEDLLRNSGKNNYKY
jgi:nucleoside-diphosphate-sugar epimerase